MTSLAGAPPTRLEDTIQKMIDQVTTTKPATMTGPTGPTAMTADVAKMLGLDSLTGIVPAGPTGPVKPATTPLSDSAVKVSTTETVATPPLASELAASATAAAEKTHTDLAVVKQDIARIEKKIEEGFAAIMVKVSAQKQEPVIPPTVPKQFSDILPTAAEVQAGMAGGARKRKVTRKGKRSVKKYQRFSKKTAK